MKREANERGTYVPLQTNRRPANNYKRWLVLLRMWTAPQFLSSRCTYGWRMFHMICKPNTVSNVTQKQVWSGGWQERPSLGWGETQEQWKTLLSIPSMLLWNGFIKICCCFNAILSFAFERVKILSCTHPQSYSCSSDFEPRHTAISNIHLPVLVEQPLSTLVTILFWDRCQSIILGGQKFSMYWVTLRTESWEKVGGIIAGALSSIFANCQSQILGGLICMETAVCSYGDYEISSKIANLAYFNSLENNTTVCWEISWVLSQS